MPTDTDRTTFGGPPRVEVRDLLTRIAEDRGLTFEPAPANVIDALPELQRTVDELAGRLDEQERRWLAAALAALSHHVLAGTLGGPDLAQVGPVTVAHRDVQVLHRPRTRLQDPRRRRALPAPAGEGRGAVHR